MDSARAAAAEALRQVAEGADIPSPTSLLRNVTPEKAAVQLPGAPYSMLTNLAHAVFWQELWLNRLRGRPVKGMTEDWKVPEPAEWQAIRARFLEDLDEALRVARSEPFEHQMKSDDDAVNRLIRIAVHDAYHLGQINLLKRQLRLLDRGS